MRLIDRIAQCRLPFVVQNTRTNIVTRLSGVAEYAEELTRCPTRFVLNDDLTGLCTALAYSKGASTLSCADLLHIPAERVWVEWCEAPWRRELSLYGFAQAGGDIARCGRRGALIRASSDGRRGCLRTFWTTGEAETEILASSMETYFDLDVPDGEEPAPPTDAARHALSVVDPEEGGAAILRRCFRFHYEQSWAEYYATAALEAPGQAAIDRHALRTIAIDVPLLLAFFLLLGTRSGLPQRDLTLERLNRSRTRAGKAPLLDHIEVLSPLLPSYQSASSNVVRWSRHSPRLHHVRGHLVRRGSQLFWRVPHVRGSARTGVIRSRTVTWSIDKQQCRGRVGKVLHEQSH